MTVSKGAAGKAMVIFISNICRRSTEEEQRLGQDRTKASDHLNWTQTLLFKKQ